MRDSFQNINFGFASAETEGAEDPQLLQNAFLDQFKAIDSVINGKKFFILGTKGSGKSAIGEKLRLLANEKHDLFVTVRNLSSFPYKSFGRIVPGKDEPEIKYHQAWDWLLLISILSTFAQDQKIQEKENILIYKLLKILEDNKVLPAEDIKQLATKSAKKNFKVRVPVPVPFMEGFTFEGGLEKPSNSMHETKIPLLNEILIREVMKFRSNSRHLLIIDGLDDVLISGCSQYRILSALIQTCHSLNQKFKRNDVPLCIIVLCRSDIYEVLPNPNKNKLKQDYAIVLDWYHDPQHPEESGLIHLSKLRSMLSRPNLDIYDQCFPESVDGIDCKKKLLDLTRHIPRDFLQLLSHIQLFLQPEPSLPFITRKEIMSGERSYSLGYFLPEVRDTLTGFLEQDTIDFGISLIGSMRKREFMLDEFNAHMKDCFIDCRFEFDARKFLNAMFQVGAIGNKTQRSSSVMYTFKFRNPNSSINYSEVFTIHRGLWKAWNLI